jgi:hypothetical protein
MGNGGKEKLSKKDKNKTTTKDEVRNKTYWLNVVIMSPIFYDGKNLLDLFGAYIAHLDCLVVAFLLNTF